MEARIDAAGNVVGRYEVTDPGCRRSCWARTSTRCATPATMTAISACIAAIEAVAALHAAGERLPFAIEVLGLRRRGRRALPGKLTGSRAVAGTFDPQPWTAPIRRHRDPRGAAQLRLRSRRHPRLARRPTTCWAMSSCISSRGRCWRLKLPVGIVTAINGASRFRIEVTGDGRPCRHGANGPAPGRAGGRSRDGAGGRAAAQRTPGMVATVGRLEALPGALNVIPGKAPASRSTSAAPIDADRLKASRAPRARVRTRSPGAHVRVKVEQCYDEPAATCDPALVEQLEARGRALPASAASPAQRRRP